MRKLALFASFLLLSVQLLAQNVVVKGVVKDANGEPVIGAAITQEGTQNITITDIDGNYSIKVPSSAKLAISCVGFATRTEPVNGRTEITVALEVDTHVLDDVIVVAFGKETKESFTGSATVVKSNKIAERQVSSPISALNGQVAGLQMVEGNGPSSTPSIRIRGVGSINASNSPLIILDGLPYNGYWSDINPQDVESISVLKDAASNALYGARGANGVIMITTKTAKRGRATITLDAKVGANMDGKVYYDYVDDPATYYELYYQMLYNYYKNRLGQKYSVARTNALNSLGGESSSGGLGYIVYDVPDGQYLIGEDGKLNPNATLGRKVTGADGNEYLLYPDNWKKEGIRTGLRHEYNLNISGGNETFQFLASLGYLSNQGLSYGSAYERFTTRAKADYQARPWLKVGASFNYTKNVSDSQSNAFACAYNMSPIYPLYVRDGEGNIITDSHGKVYDYGDGAYTDCKRPVYINDNPMQSDILDINRNDSNAFCIQGYADIRFYKDLVLTVNGSVYDTENRWNSTANPYYGYFQNTGGYVYTYHYRTYDINLQQLLRYNHTFGQGHNVSAMLGHEYNQNSSTTLGAGKSNVLAYEAITELDGALIKESITGSKEMTNTEGFFFRGQYDYSGKYFGSVSFRRDGSSTFHPDHCWGNFWSAGGAWIISKENWFNVPAFDMLKYKLSYGKQGNDGISEFSYTRKYNITTVNSEAAITFSSQGNENISWETNNNLNTGIEFELWKGRLSGGVDLYYRKTTDMLLWKSVALGMGYSGYYDNVGDMVNKGVEFTLNGDIIRTKKVTWSANFNISHNKNLVTYLPEEKASSTIEGHGGYLDGDRFVGQGLPIYTWYLKRYAGVNEDGLPTWYYTDGDELKTSTNWDNGDYYLCGDPHPTVYGGFGTALSLYGFDLSVNMLYSVGGTVFDGGYQSLMGVPYSGYTGYNIHKDMLKAWTKDNPDTDIPRAQYNDDNIAATSDRFLIDGSSLTLKSINAGYTFPSKFTEKIKISSLRVYFSCDNICYISRRKGLDPRTSFKGSTSGTGYSPMRTMSGGVTIKF